MLAEKRVGACKLSIFLSEFNQNFNVQIFVKVASIEFCENPFSDSRFVTCGKTDIEELIGVFLTVVANA